MNKSISKITHISLLALTVTVVAQAKVYTFSFTFPPQSFSLSKGLSTTYNSRAGTVLLKDVPLACAVGLFLLYAPWIFEGVKFLKKPLDFYDKHVIERIIGKGTYDNRLINNATIKKLGLTVLLAIGLPLLGLTTFAGLSVYNSCG